ncbi:MAG: transglutaminase domain-containing protein [Thermoleophilia bacterium]|nr:transglutaminase domain-containing protein [Thermoleophilia bacterium]
MPRTLPLYPLPAVLIASGWARLDDRADDGLLLGLLLLALLPALVRPHWGRAVAALGVSLVAVDAVYGLAPGRGYLAALWSRFTDGVLGFYDVTLPFSAVDEPLLHDVTLLAVFAFALAFGLALAARRPVLASAFLLLGAVWPAAMVPGRDLARGAVLLAAVLLLLAFGGRRATRAPRPALVAGAVLVAAAVAASTSAAVAKPQFVAWEGWDFYDRPDDPVSVRFLWDATYRGFEWPEKETKVLEVRGTDRHLYWRATTLDTFTQHRWIENLPILGLVEGRVDLRSFPDGLLPDRAYVEGDWVRTEVEVEALSDDHLVAPSTPVAYDPRSLGVLRISRGGVAFSRGALPRGTTYAVWSYAPAPKPEQLARARRLDFDRVRRYLQVAPNLAVPPFGEPNRESAVESVLDSVERLRPYRALVERARAVVGNPTNQYAAVVGLEAWFRSEGGFNYDESPPPASGAPPLVAFLDSQRGYCQHYAGAMALMLRFLGIPARVAVGFTSGSWDDERRVWSVTDHDAHAWVEVWFPGWGWLPFDPTPARGQLSSPYSYGGIDFDAAGAGRVLESSSFGGDDPALTARIRGLSERKAGEEVGSGGGGGYGPIVRERGASLLKLLLLLAAGAAVGIQLVKRVVRGRRYLTQDARRIAGACRQEVVDFLADQGIDVPRSSTPRELARELDRALGIDARAFARALSAARYAPERDSRAAGRRLRRELRSLRRAIRARVGVPRRALGAVSLRSLAA